MLMLAALVAASGCNREQRLAEQAAAQAAAAEDAAAQAEVAFESAVAAQNWALAKAQAEVLLATYPQSAAAVRVQSKLAEVTAKAEAQREQSRMAGLWTYLKQPVKGGIQASASIYAKEPLDVDGSGAKPVRLIFRDHPAWGKSSYLVLETGDFACHGGCKVKVTVDAKAAKSMAALRPETDEAIAMFINDERALWRMTDGATLLKIEFPVKSGGTRTATFEVAGLDRSQLPGW
ncbi:MAG: hypothetical protein ABIR05_07560 [Luteimonas sp.]